MVLKLSDIIGVQFGHTLDWEIMFVPSQGSFPPPPPFLSWFPAVDVDTDVFDLQHQIFETPLGTFSIPKNANQRNIKITFLDDEVGTLEVWMDHWVNHRIRNNGKGINHLSKCLNKVVINKLGTDKKFIRPYLLWICPEGSLQNVFNSKPEVKAFSQNFKIYSKSTLY
jgi:hypothetical protein